MKPSIFKMSVRCNRRAWLLMSLVAFIGSSLFRWIPEKGGKRYYSLYDVIVYFFENIDRDLSSVPRDVLIAGVWLSLMAGLYVTFSAIVGWVIAAIFSVICQWLKRCRTFIQ